MSRLDMTCSDPADPKATRKSRIRAVALVQLSWISCISGAGAALACSSAISSSPFWMAEIGLMRSWQRRDPTNAASAALSSDISYSTMGGSHE